MGGESFAVLLHVSLYCEILFLLYLVVSIWIYETSD